MHWKDWCADARVVRYPMSAVCEPYIRRKAVRHMEKGRVVIFAAAPAILLYDRRAAALRASEMQCRCDFEGDQVDGRLFCRPRQGEERQAL